MNIHYFEVVTRDVDREIAVFEKVQGLKFGAPVAALGNARTAPHPAGGSVGIRAPLSDTELPVLRPYFLTENIADAVADIEGLGAQIAMAPTLIDGHGTFAIYILDGVQYGLWQV